MWPGLITFTRMRRSRSSLVQLRAKERTAAFSPKCASSSWRLNYKFHYLIFVTTQDMLAHVNIRKE